MSNSEEDEDIKKRDKFNVTANTTFNEFTHTNEIRIDEPSQTFTKMDFRTIDNKKRFQSTQNYDR